MKTVWQCTTSSISCVCGSVLICPALSTSCVLCTSCLGLPLSGEAENKQESISRTAAAEPYLTTAHEDHRRLPISESRN